MNLKAAIEKVRVLSAVIPAKPGSTQASLNYASGCAALAELADAAEAVKDKRAKRYRVAVNTATRYGDGHMCMTTFLAKLVGGAAETQVNKAWSRAVKEHEKLIRTRRRQI